MATARPPTETHGTTPPSKRLLRPAGASCRTCSSASIAPRRPAGWPALLDFGSAAGNDPTENITDELRRRLGDVVWSIDRRAGDGGVQTLHVGDRASVGRGLLDAATNS